MHSETLVLYMEINRVFEYMWRRMAHGSSPAGQMVANVGQLHT